jgi:hypothetical protein
MQSVPDGGRHGNRYIPLFPLEIFFSGEAKTEVSVRAPSRSGISGTSNNAPFRWPIRTLYSI